MKKLKSTQEESGRLIISTGTSRFSKTWKPKEILWSDLIKNLSEPVRTKETTAEYHRMSKSARDDIKDVGGFVGGALKDSRRKAENVANRTLITLDMDSIDITTDEIWDLVTLFYGYESVIYSTHSHTPDSPRLRLVFPLARAVYPDEYQAISRRVADDIGLKYFDETTYEPSRLMYWPSVTEDGEYIFKHNKGAWLDPDQVLSSYHDWTDITEWPISHRQRKSLERSMKKQEDPLEKQGIVGAFCRTYTIAEVIDEYLSDVYRPGKSPDRYTYIDGSTEGGLVVYDDKFAYSHHGTDPTSGMLCNAFDLVRLHLYGLMDEDAKEDTPVNRLPSYTKMSRVASEDDNVKIILGLEQDAEVEDDFDYDDIDREEIAWKTKLSYDRKGRLENTIDNALIILENDPKIKGKLIYNAFENRAMVEGKVPWRDDVTDHDWSDTDDSGLRHYMEDKYSLTTAYKIEDAKNLAFNQNQIHPVKEYFETLKWDGKERVETLLIDYLGAEDSVYTREVSKVHLTAAVARILTPGCKYDHMVTLSGAQGIGKSTLIRKLSKGWYSDSLDTVKGKEAAELIQGRWHIEMSELYATRKADRDAIKSFLSRQDDIYRVAYARNATRFPRQCVFWGTTNEISFLRDPTGDRRTFPVLCEIEKATKSVFTDLDDEVDQIWAEAIELFKKGQPLYLRGEAAKIALRKQEEAKEDVPLAGMIEEFLEIKLPKYWDELDIYERRGYINGEDNLVEEKDATEIRDKVCVMEIWCELLGKKPGDLKPINSREINDILRGLKGWSSIQHPIRFGEYGSQRGFKRDLK